MTASETELAVRTVAAALTRFRYRFASEDQLHAGIAQALESDGFVYQHEHQASPHCRFDFWIPAKRIVIEAKIDGSLSAAFRQIDGYLQLDSCDAVVIAATKNWANELRRDYRIRGKLVRVVRLSPQAF